MRLINYIKKNSTVKDEEIEVIKFGIQMFRMIIAAVLLSVIIASISKMLTEGIMFLIFLIPMRQMAGGYHTKNKISCYVISVFIYVISLILIKYENCSLYIQVPIYVINLLIIIYLSPVDNFNNKLEENHKAYLGKKIKYIIIFNSIIYLTLIILRLEYWSFIILLSQGIVALLLIAGWLQIRVSNIHCSSRYTL